MLTLEVELLTGAYRASLPDGSAAEWPPHPERVFSALVQAWGDGERAEDERAALRWLERLGPPEIEASAWASQRTATTVYVPPNDAKGADPAVLPDRRRRQARSFRAAVPPEPLIRYRWSDSPDPAVARSLRVLASRVASIGHSSALVRCAFSEDGSALDRARLWRAAPDGGESLRGWYPGRLEDLERWFERGERPKSSRPMAYRSPAEEGAGEAPASVFGGPADWIVFEEAGGFQPDLLAFAHVARRVRDALMSVGPQPPSEIVSGHSQEDRPSSRPHLAVVPLANVGWERSSGDLLGFALVLPRHLTEEERTAVLRSVVGLVRFEGDQATAELRLTRKASWSLERSASPSRSSLRPGRWCRTARVWASATPVVLDRFSDGDPCEEALTIAAACTHVGLPEPVEIEIHRHSAVKGSPPAQRGRGPDWTFPAGSKIAGRPRRHVVLRFAQPVRGPVILGAGRYHGFGLLLPLEENDEHATPRH